MKTAPRVMTAMADIRKGGGRSAPLDGGDQRLTAKAYEAIANLIRGRRLKGGDVIVESRVAAVLNISRTPLREALLRLEGEGLVVRGLGRSLIVRHVDLKEYLQSLKVREVVEPEAAALACGRVAITDIQRVRAEIEALINLQPYDVEEHWRTDASLHELFISNCGNDVLMRMIRQLRTTTHLFEVARLSDRLGPDSTEHFAILNALESGDPRSARKAAQVHIRSLHRFALETLQ
jgi:DNA-binding GntR family transcriptional regulator